MARDELQLSAAEKAEVMRVAMIAGSPRMISIMLASDDVFDPAHMRLARSMEAELSRPPPEPLE